MNDPIEEVRSPGAGWVVAIAHGGRYLGRLYGEAARWIELAPVYELNVQLVKAGHNGDGTPKIGIVYGCTPVLMLPSWTCMRLPIDALYCRLEDLTPPERNRLMAAAKQGAAIAEQMKLEESSIAREARIVRP